MSDKAFFVNTLLCTGCRSCQVACKSWNSLPGEEIGFFQGPDVTSPGKLSAVTWTRVVFRDFRKGDGVRPQWDMMPSACFHCRDAACLRGCPEKAIRRREGWVVIDQARCSGCGRCTDLCPYGVPHVSAVDHAGRDGRPVIVKGKAYKCDACTGNRRDIPSCAANCLTGAITFGYRLQILKEAAGRLAAVKREHPGACIYGIHESGGLRVILLLRDNPKNYGLPAAGNS